VQTRIKESSGQSAAKSGWKDNKGKKTHKRLGGQKRQGHIVSGAYEKGV
jgi:hypothetical protein